MPPVVDSTSGVKTPFSISTIRDDHNNYFLFIFMLIVSREQTESAENSKFPAYYICS